MSREWQDNADEFGALTKQGKDVRLALLVACSVEKGSQGGDTSMGQLTHANGKTSARLFAERAGMPESSGHKRVLRHLAAWDAFATEFGLPLAVDLLPDDALDLAVSEEQAEAFGKIRITPTPTPAPPPVVVEESQPAAPVQVSLQGSRRTGGPAEQSRPRVGGWNLTRSEKERIGPDIEDLYVNEGYSISEIQRAYGFKSNASVRAILNERGVMTNLGRSRGEDPPPVNWRGEPTTVVRSESSEPEPAPVTQIPHWRNSTHVNAMNHMAGVSRADNGLNYMAYLVRDALVAEDAEWLVETLAQVRFLSQRFADYVAIFEDPEFRQRCMTDPEVRDDWQAMIASENPER